ncbi:oxysterol-binding protein domain-containing protein [Phthorimaea operculella]|nr:oxysterol-binding protein domain-containing protein [Phthorimaea operculella]
MHLLKMPHLTDVTLRVASHVYSVELAPNTTSLPVAQFSRGDFSLWSVLKNCVGKELSKITMPVVFNEPLSFLQRMLEYLEYAHLLRMASEQTDPVARMEYIAGKLPRSPCLWSSTSRCPSCRGCWSTWSMPIFSAWRRNRRIRLPGWSILLVSFQDLFSKITMPVVFNEPLSFLQRMLEYLEYAHLLRMASEQTDPVARMEYIAGCWSTWSMPIFSAWRLNRRIRLPGWSILPELSKITMPLVFNESLSFLQRMLEYLLYAHLLRIAFKQTDPVARMEYIAGESPGDNHLHISTKEF